MNFFLNLPRESMHVLLDFAFTPNPRVKFKQGKISIILPFLFFLKKSDLKKKNAVHQIFSEKLRNIILTVDECNYIESFFKFIKKPQKAKKGKLFTLFHEIAHIFFKDHENTYKNLEESRMREKRADLWAAKVLKDTEGGIYLFEILNRYCPSAQNGTHPSYQERIEYLKKFHSA